jgi:hypothetical protein
MGAATATDPLTTFTFSPGAERLVQHHQGTSDAAQTEQRSVDLMHAYWLAHVSQLAYATPDDARKQLAAMGLPNDDAHVRFFDNRCTDTQAMYVSTVDLSAPPETLGDAFNVASKGFAVLAFRGTEPTHWKDVATDLLAIERGGSPLGKAHAGFAKALDSVWSNADPSCGVPDPIQPFLAAHHRFDASGPRPVRTGAELYFTGHSLGGALATLALGKTISDACTNPDCDQIAYVPVSALYTYGAPRSFDREFANNLAEIMRDRTPIMRVVHETDIVPFVPGFPFQHPGFADNETDFQVLLEGSDVIVADPTPRFEPGIELLTDHELAGYINALAPHTSDPRPQP